MSNQINSNPVLVYFRRPKNYFWTWKENGTIIEWDDPLDLFLNKDVVWEDIHHLSIELWASYWDHMDKESVSTLCYRADLEDWLRAIAPIGLPNLDFILFVLAACQENWLRSQGRLAITFLATANYDGKEWMIDTHLTKKLQHGLAFLDRLNRLKPGLRSGNNRVLLFSHLLKEVDFRLEPEQSNGIVEGFASGRYDTAIQKYLSNGSKRTFVETLEVFEDLADEYPTTEALEYALQTGVQEAPKVVPMDLPPIDLLTELTENPATKGLAQLTKRVIAALQIPIKSVGSSDLPLGGVSDITNRGSFDRLLISELAYDNQTLMARLVNNEALYLKREEPPGQEVEKRVLLVDGSIKMWGTPRIFALSAALACIEGVAESMELTAYLIGDQTYTKVDLSNAEGIMDSLGILFGSLDAMGGLEAFAQSNLALAGQENVFITLQSHIEDVHFGMKLKELSLDLHYLIGLDRTGALSLYKLVNGNRKRLNTAKFDLPSLLFHKNQTQVVLQKRGQIGLPAILREWPMPLNFPVHSFAVSATNCYGSFDHGFIGIDRMQRVSYWSPSKGESPLELLPYIETGNYYFARHTPRLWGIVVEHKYDNLLKYYVFDIDEETYQEVDLYAHKLDVHNAKADAKFWYLKLPDKIAKIKIGTNQLGFKANNVSWAQLSNTLSQDKEIRAFINGRYTGIKAFMNPRFNVLKRVDHVFIDQKGRLVLNKWILTLRISSDHMVWDRKGGESPALYKASYIDSMQLEDNPKVYLRRFKWEDGSEALLDNRGVLHLRSSNEEIPEIAIPLALKKRLGLWASDGTFGGWDYFRREKGGSLEPEITMWEFYHKYIKAFIHHIGEVPY